MKYSTQILTDTRTRSLFHKMNPIKLTGVEDKEGIIRFYDIKLKYVKICKISSSSMRSKSVVNSNMMYKSQLWGFTFRRLSGFFNLFDLAFLRKEKRYTKLKYSRSPQYDIVSGGVAAIFSAFIGFLISEKFGIELVDSGDFYTLFMYVVFLSFSMRPLLKLLSKFDTTVTFFSITPVVTLFGFFFSFLINSLVAVLDYLICLFETAFRRFL